MPTLEAYDGEIEQAARPQEDHILPPAARKAALFTLGVVASTIEEGYSLVHRVIENTQAAEKEGRKRYEALMEKRRQAAQPAQPSDIHPAADAHAPLPARSTFSSRADIDALHEQITRLSQQIERLG